MTEPDLAYQVFALSLKQEGAISHFATQLPISVMQSDMVGHSQFYRALLDFYKNTGSDPVDRVAFCSWLETETKIHEALGGKKGVEEYLDNVMKVPLSKPEVVAAVLKRRYNREQQKKHVQELGKIFSEEIIDEETVEKVEELSLEIRELNHSAADPLKSVYDGQRIAENANNIWDLPDFLATPYKSLNRALGYSDNSGVSKGAVHAVLAPSGMGKSTLCKNLMNHWVDNGHTVLYVNYEEAQNHWEQILFNQITGQNIHLGDNLTELQKKHYSQLYDEQMKKWDGNFLVRHDMDTPYFEDIESWVRSVVNSGKNIDVLMIDTIQSMFLKRGRNLPRWGQYEEMMVRLEKLAKDIHCAIIITAQENSNRMKEKREVVQQSDVGGSLTIVQKCSATIFITKAKDIINDDSVDEHIMQLQIPKNRITGNTFMKDPPMLKYNDATKSYEEYEVPPDDAYQRSAVNFSDDGYY